jgi:putative chitinase
MNRSIFFKEIRENKTLFRSSALTQTQVEGLDALLSGFTKHLPRGDARWLAYGLATAHLEVGGTFQPVREGFKETDAEARSYVKLHYWTMKSGKSGYGRPAGPYSEVYYGRGFVQLTWLFNYEKAAKALGIDFVKHPDYVLRLDDAVAIMWLGMSRGWFTGKKLSDYFNGGSTNWVDARRIINGTDKAKLIAQYAQAYYSALIAAGFQDNAPVNNKPLTESRTLQGGGVSAIGISVEHTTSSENVKAAIEKAIETLTPVADKSELASTMLTYLSFFGTVLAIVGLVYVVYARLDDAGKIPWGKK